MNTVPMKALVTNAVALLIAASLLAGCEFYARPKQPVDFSHAKHTALNMNCQMCHPFVRQSRLAGIVGVFQCNLCHSKDAEQSKTRVIRDYTQRNDEIRWPKVYRLPPDVVFSHKKHVLYGEIECETCHGDVKNMDEPISEPVAIAVTMDGCISCHENKSASTDCTSCHK